MRTSGVHPLPYPLKRVSSAAGATDHVAVRAQQKCRGVTDRPLVLHMQNQSRRTDIHEESMLLSQIIGNRTTVYLSDCYAQINVAIRVASNYASPAPP
jgi:hypothetical protein